MWMVREWCEHEHRHVLHFCPVTTRGIAKKNPGVHTQCAPRCNTEIHLSALQPLSADICHPEVPGYVPRACNDYILDAVFDLPSSTVDVFSSTGAGSTLGSTAGSPVSSTAASILMLNLTGSQPVSTSPMAPNIRGPKWCFEYRYNVSSWWEWVGNCCDRH